MKQRFVVSQLVLAPQKILYALFAFILAYGLFLLIGVMDEFSLLTVFLSLLTLVFFLCGCLCLFGYNGIEVDVQARTWKTYTGMPGLKYGKTEPLPVQMDCILLFESVSPDPYQMEMGVYEVSVIYNGRQKQVFLETQSRKYASDLALKLANLFKLEVKDMIMHGQ